MRWTLSVFLVSSISVLSAQRNYECDQLAIAFHGIVATDNGDQLFFEVSNASYTGTLFNYPGFLLIDEKGDTIAQEETTYYGIGTNFQTHLLNIESAFSLPFKGRLELWGSFYQHSYCSFPMEIEDADFVERSEVEEEPLKIATNYAGDQLVVDLGGVYYEEELTYQIEVVDEYGTLGYSAKLESTVVAIPVSKIAGTGGYVVSILDEAGEVILSSDVVYLE
ncbi:MAG: hypothetical protein AAFP77_00100 [Bacteroidota bacterium]